MVKVGVSYLIKRGFHISHIPNTEYIIVASTDTNVRMREGLVGLLLK